MLKFGVCIGPEAAPQLAAAGYDYIEINVQAHLKPEAPESEFHDLAESLRQLPLPCRAANCFLPGGLKVVGPAVNFDRLTSYAASAFARAERIGMKAIVFGSGGARQVPEGFPREEAWAQAVRFGRMCGTLAQEHEVTVVLEPLNRGETNIFNSVAEGARWVREVGHPNVQLLVDGYHWARENEPAADIVSAGPLLQHAHTATYATRLAPGLEPCDHVPFFQALKAAGYSGGISIEGRWNDLAAEAGPALQVLREAAARAGY